MRWVGYVARVWRREMHAGFWWRKLEERGRLEGPDIGERIIFQWILKI